MFCPKCGTNVAEGSAFCPSCGAQLAQPEQPTQPTQPFQQQPQTPELPMKWFKFLIYFALFAGAAVNAINGFSMLFGKSRIFMEAFILDKAAGIAFLALAGIGIYARIRLAGFYKNGPQMLLTVYIVGAVINVAYLVGTYAIFSDSVYLISPVPTIASVITSCIMIGVNNVYFQKRSHLFTK
ncbi:MAG: zinc ribbon domain-containing protein [Ruminococcaceae bacterium]|nr:zinc ribbon domain-containing protein [Oscillospiraceae bacterium]